MEDKDVGHKKRYWSVGPYVLKPGAGFEVARPVALTDSGVAGEPWVTVFADDRDALWDGSRWESPRAPRSAAAYAQDHERWGSLGTLGVLEPGTRLRVSEIRRTFVYARTDHVTYTARIESGRYAGTTVVLDDHGLGANHQTPALRALDEPG